MAHTCTLYGYRFSVYTRIVRMVLMAKTVPYAYREIDPFAHKLDQNYLDIHPFGRVPSFVHGEFALYETSVIARYIDDAFDGDALQPVDPQVRARSAQIIAVTDNYGYWPMVRQVFSHAVFRPAEGSDGSAEEITTGLFAAKNVLAALEQLTGPRDRYLVGNDLTLADLHLGAMLAYFTMTPKGDEMLHGFPRLSTWWERMRGHQLILATDPGLPDDA